ncbi:ParB/RepB/Spo0J family partition protein [Spirochaetota bacterium]
MTKKALGKGLDAIISKTLPKVDKNSEGYPDVADKVVELDINKIIPNPNQPRVNFDESEIKELSNSIKSVGLIQPIAVRKVKNDYILIAGERRLRACKAAGQKKIKVIIIDANDEKSLIITLVENIQREDLDPIEEAKAYKYMSNKFNLKQQEIARHVGKDRATISNSIRLLNLPSEIQQALSMGKISTGHAKVILSTNGESQQLAIYKKIIDGGLSVRALEDLVKNKSKNPKGKKRVKDAHIKKMEEKLMSILGTKVEIKHAGKKGKIEIIYYSLDDFERIIELLK